MAGDSGGKPATGPTDRVSFDELFNALSHHRRRYVIECLDRYGSPMTLPDVADECTVMEHRKVLDDIPASTVSRMYMSLYDTHIPKLVAINAVEYDQESDSVAIGQNASRLLPHLTLSRTSLSSQTEQALETLTRNDNGKSMTTKEAKETLHRAGYADTAVEILTRLENTGYLFICDGRVQLVDW